MQKEMCNQLDHSNNKEGCGHNIYHTYNNYCCKCGNPEEDYASIIPSIGENGNWFIGETDTGVKAQGEKGETGSQGPKGDTGPAGMPGPAGSFANMEILFNGDAGVIGQTYSLTGAVNDYKCLVAELSTYNIYVNEWLNGYIWVINPMVTSYCSKYGGCHIYDIIKKGGVHAYWHFPTASTMVIDILSDYEDNINTKITKLYGMK